MIPYGVSHAPLFLQREHSPDQDGEELPNEEAARQEALESIRDILSEGAYEGWDRTDWTMAVSDEGGRAVATIPFSSALRKQPKLARP